MSERGRQGEPLRVDTAVEGRTTTLTLAGELTYATAPLLEEHVGLVLDPTRPLLVLDVGRLQFCDSVGLSALIGTQRRARLAGGGVTLRSLHGSLQRSLHVTGVGALFSIVAPHERPDAPAAVSPGRAGETA